MSVIEKLKSDILPKAVAEGKFGKDRRNFIDFKKDENFNAADQFASSIYFGDVILETEKRERVTQSVVIKAQAGGKLFEIGQKFGLNITLFNEFLFYTEILPLLIKCDKKGEVCKIFPKCFYGSVGDDPVDDILIFENVQKYGFKPSQSKAFIDYDHITLTLKWLGKFHALSLICKQKFPEKFKEIASKLVEPMWTEQRLNKNSDKFYVENAKRGVLPLLKDPSYGDKVREILAVVEEADLSMAKLVTPVEPLALICHGDFCRNNIFYKYNSDNVPTEVIFFDLAVSRYSSPVIDLSFFLFMNSSPEVRSRHWGDILRTYHSALASNPDLDPKDTPSLEDIKQDIRRRGVYGYVHAGFYLPMMLSEEKTEEDWCAMSMDDLIKLRLNTGGEKSTFYLMELVKHMIDQKYDFKYITDFKLKF